MLVYFKCDLLIGLLTSGWLLILVKLSNFYNAFGEDPTTLIHGSHIQLAIAVKAIAWIMQFVGHGLMEKRAPALLTNLLFANIAPFFVTAEIMKMVFGYKAQECREFDKTIEADIAYYRL